MGKDKNNKGRIVNVRQGREQRRGKKGEARRQKENGKRKQETYTIEERGGEEGGEGEEVNTLHNFKSIASHVERKS